MIINCTGCSESIELPDIKFNNVVLVACPICNAKNKIMPKVEQVTQSVSEPSIEVSKLTVEKPRKLTLIQRVKKWLSL